MNLVNTNQNKSEKFEMKKNTFLTLAILLMSICSAKAHSDQTLNCSDSLGNALELNASKHIKGKLTLKDPSSGVIRNYKIDIGGEYGRANYAILAASPTINGEFFFSDPVDWNLDTVKSVNFHSGHWGWGEYTALSLSCTL